MRFTKNLRALSFVLPGLVIGLGSMTTNAALAQQATGPVWVKICSKVADNDTCNVKFEVVSNTGQLVTSVNLLQSKGTTNRRTFQVAVPSGRYIPEGVKVQIDGGNVNTVPYFICVPSRCLAEIQLSDALVKALKAGGALTLTSTNFRAEKNPVKVSLKGFTAAFDGPAMNSESVEQRQKELESQLKKRAQETAEKLKAAQDAAKAGN